MTRRYEPAPATHGPRHHSEGNLHANFPTANAGKTAYYALRWVSTRGEKGPWSEITTATVAA